MNYGVYEYFKQGYGEGLTELYFRTKENGGWPGNVILKYKDSSEKYLDKKARMEVKNYFMPECCLYCLNKMNKNADISLGDNYIKRLYDEEGKSVIIVRSDRGENVFRKYESLFEQDIISESEFLESAILLFLPISAITGKSLSNFRIPLYGGENGQRQQFRLSSTRLA